MDARKILDKLEHDLSHFMIGEFTKDDPMKRASADMYKYKGLSITADPNSKAQEKTVAIRIGPLEAEFKIENGEKTSGALAPFEENVIMIWMNQSDNSTNLKALFSQNKNKADLKIIPFDLEHYFEN